MTEAAYWFNYLKTTYTNAFVGKQANETLDDYAIGQIMTDNSETDMNKVTDSISAMFHRAFICLVLDEDDRYADYEGLAKKVFDHYHVKIGDISKQRLKLHSLAEMKQRVLDQELDPDQQRALMTPEDQAILRTKLGLPPPKATPVPSRLSLPRKPRRPGRAAH